MIKLTGNQLIPLRCVADGEPAIFDAPEAEDTLLYIANLQSRIEELEDVLFQVAENPRLPDEERNRLMDIVYKGK